MRKLMEEVGGKLVYVISDELVLNDRFGSGDRTAVTNAIRNAPNTTLITNDRVLMVKGGGAAVSSYERQTYVLKSGKEARSCWYRTSGNTCVRVESVLALWAYELHLF